MLESADASKEITLALSDHGTPGQDLPETFRHRRALDL